MIRPCLGRASVIIQRVTGFKPLLSIPSTSYIRLVSDDVLNIRVVEPRNVINLDSWSAYSSLPDDISRCNQLLVLVQAVRHVTDKTKQSDDGTLVPAFFNVHVFQNNPLLAWKFDDKYQVILRTTLHELVKMVDAFGQGMLTMGDDLDICRLMTIHNKGYPFTPSRSQYQVFKYDINETSDTGSQFISNDEVSDGDESSETINIPTQKVILTSMTKGKLNKSDKKDVTKPDNFRNKEDEGSNIDSSANKCQNTRTCDKPPNILLYTGTSEDDSAFCELKQLIEHSVNKEAYTIYHLKPDQLLTTPWMNNVALLVNTCDIGNQSTDNVFADFFRKGGKVLSFCSSFVKEFVDVQTSVSTGKMISFDYKDWHGIHAISSQHFIQKSSGKTCNTKFEILGKKSENGEGLIAVLTSDISKAVIIGVHLDKDPLSNNSSHFMALKESNNSRMAIIVDLLKLMNINCTSSSSPELTPAYLLASSTQVKTMFIESLKEKLQNSCLKGKLVTLKLLEKESLSEKTTDVYLPVIVKKSVSASFKYFTEERYWQNLASKGLGHVLIYSDVIPTTMTLFDGFMFCVPNTIAVVAVAGRQTSGKGRGGNSWLSPVGCAMFSIHVQIDKDSELGRKVTFLQHIMSLAVVQSVTTLPGCSELPLKLKWPNDIYYGRNIKLGGVIVNCNMMGSTIHAVIGCGFNVSNSNPTICINDIIAQYNKEHGTTIPPCSCEQLIARTVTKTEELMDLFQSKGHEAFCKLYYENWIHSRERVKVECINFENVTVCGLDEFGFLSVEKDDGSVFSLQPDGNSFDIMHNLIVIKNS